MTPTKIALTPIEDALASLRDRLKRVACERVELSAAVGRVLAEPIVADRPSPPADVSAMDGVAIRIGDLPVLASPEGIRLAGEAAIGAPATRLPAGKAMWIFTGGPVPIGADAVVQREWVIESGDSVRLAPEVAADAVYLGAHIRRRGENANTGDEIAPAGVVATPPIIAALAGVGAVEPLVRRRVRVALIVTGDELADASASPTTTGLRDSNGPSVAALLSSKRWIDVISVDRVGDRLDRVCDALRAASDRADCVITTGGVSMGDHDHVPAAAASLGAETLFHRLAIKPGKPIFAAMHDGGPLVIGLPGNPVSALVTARRIALEALGIIAGAPLSAVGAEARVRLVEPLDGASRLTRFVLVERLSVDSVRPVPSKGSGDAASAARSDGFVEIPAGDNGESAVDFYSWSGA